MFMSVCLWKAWGDSVYECVSDINAASPCGEDLEKCENNWRFLGFLIYN